MTTKTTIETKTIEVEVKKNYATPEDLIQFLVERNLLNRYLSNLIDQRDVNIFDLKECFLKKSLFSISFIVGAFLWEETPEGHDFWEEVSREWYTWWERNNIIGFIDE